MSSLQTATVNIHRSKARPEIVHSGLTARMALDEQTRNDAFSVRHASYLSGGYIDPMPGGIFSDADDLKPNSRSVVIYQWDQPVASVRMCLLDQNPELTGWDEIPASRVFPEEVAELGRNVTHGRPARLAEINRLVRHPDYATNYQLVFVLFRFVSYMLIEAEADLLLSCVRRNHTPFYKRMHFEYVAGPRRYAGVKFETNLMACTPGGVELIRAEMPIVGADQNTIKSYAGLSHGDSVNVFMEG